MPIALSKPNQFQSYFKDSTPPPKPEDASWMNWHGLADALTLATGAMPGQSGPAFEAYERNRNFFDAMFDLDSPVVNAWQLMTRPSFTPDPTFNVAQQLKDDGLWDEYRDNFVAVQSRPEYNYIAAKIAKEERERRTLASAGPIAGLLGGVAVGLLDPTNLIPFTWAGKGPALVRVLKGAALGMAVGTASEVPLQLNQETRTFGESAANVAWSTVLGSVLGGAAGFLPGEEPLEVRLRNAADRMVNEPGETTIPQPASVGAAALERQSLEAGGFRATSIGLEERGSIIDWTPARVVAQNEFPEARWFMGNLTDAGLEREGNRLGVSGSEAGTVENRFRANYLGRLGDFWENFRRTYADYAFDGATPKVAPGIRASLRAATSGGQLLSRKEFGEEVWKALENGDVHDNPFVEKVAQYVRKNILDPTLKEAIESGVLDSSILDQPVKGAKSHVARSYNHNLIRARQPEFEAILTQHFEQKLRDEFNKRFAKMQERQAKEDQLVSDIRRPREEVDALREQFQNDVQALDESIRDTPLEDALINIEELRRRGRGTRANKARFSDEQRKAFREEARDIEEAMGEPLAEWRAQRAGLRQRLRNLSKAAVVLEERAMRKMEKFEQLQDAAADSLMALVRKGSKVLAKLDKLSDEELDAELGKLRSLFEAVGQRYDRAVEREPAAAQGKALEPFTVVVHGGSDFGDIDPRFFGTGEPGNIRPLGNGLYSFVVDPANPEEALRAIESAKHFAEKYGKGTKKLHAFAIPNKSTASFNGARVGNFASATTPEERRWLDALAAADKLKGQARKKAFEEAAKLEPPADKMGKPQLRGEQLPGGLTELSILDPSVARRLGKFDLSDSSEDILKQLESAAPEPRTDLPQPAMTPAEKLHDKLNDISDRLEEAENLDRTEVRALVQEGLDEAVAKVQDLNSRRALQQQKLLDAASKLEGPMTEERLRSLQARGKERQREFVRAVEEMGGENFNFQTGEVKFQDTAREIARTVTNHILGTYLRLPGIDMVAQQRGSELARMLDIPHDQLVSSDGRSFLNMDLPKVIDRYLRTLLPDIELYKRFGSFAPDKGRNPAYERMFNEFAAKKAAMQEKMRAEGAKQEEIDKASLKFDNRTQQLVKTIDAVISRLRGTWGVPKDPAAFGTRAGITLLKLQALSKLGGTTIASLPDVGRPIINYGMSRFAKSLRPFISGLGNIEAPSRREARLAGVAVDALLSSRLHSMYDIPDMMAGGTKFEKGVDWLSSHMGKIALFDYWTDAMKQITSIIANGKLMDSLRLVTQGGGTEKEVGEATTYLARLGLTPEQVRVLWENITQPGGADEVRGMLWPNTDKWRDREAVTLYRQALYGENSRTVVTPGVGDRPLFMDSNLVWRMLTQFKSFGLSSLTKTLISGLQHKDMALLTGTTVSLALGMLSYYLYAVAAGGAVEARMRNEIATGNWQRFVDEGINRSGLLGALADVQNLLSEIPATRPYVTFAGSQTTRRLGGSLLESAFGPSVDALLSTEEVVRGMEFDHRGLHTMRRLFLPLQNHFLLRRAFDAIGL